MISKIIEGVLTIFILFFSIKMFIKACNESDNAFEKALYIVFSISFIFPVIIYYLDRFNIPTLLGYTANLDSSNWVEILTNYAASIVSVLLSSVILIIITKKQLDITYEQNIKINNENLRIQNLPLLKYYFTYEVIDDDLFNDNHKLILYKNDGEINSSLNFTMEIENIGLNTVRKVYLEVRSDLLNEKEIFELCNQSSIEKTQKIKKNFIVTNVPKGNYKFEISVYYQDLLKNWYKQLVNANISLTNIYNTETHGCTLIESFRVEDEEILLEEPNFIKNN